MTLSNTSMVSSLIESREKLAQQLKSSSEKTIEGVDSGSFCGKSFLEPASFDPSKRWSGSLISADPSPALDSERINELVQSLKMLGMEL